MKKIFSVIFTVLALCLLTCYASAIDVIIDGVKVEFNDSTGYPFISAENRTLVPLRATMEAFGATVRWDAETSTALVTKNEATVTCKIGENCIYRNGTKIENDTAAIIKDSRTYLPIRAVLEALDAKVDWDGSVLVTKPGAGTLVYSIENSGKKVSNYWAEWSKALELKSAGKYAECIEAMKNLAPTFLAANDYNSDAMLYNHLGSCYDKLQMTDEAAACYVREAELWELAGDHQSSLGALRRASYSGSTVQMFMTSDNESYSGRKYFGALYEPKNGIRIGVTMKYSSHEYMETFTSIAGKEAAGFILYGSIGTPIKNYKLSFEQAVKKDKIIQYALQPTSSADFNSIVENDKRYITLAKELQATGAKILVRFACEMNDASSEWYSEDYENYKTRWRYVADIFHKYAPNCAMVWSPNFYPADNMEYYYPGDKYVDYVGLSAYCEFTPETDPLGLGIDRNRFESVLDTIVGLYGHKKPIIISEGGASYYHVKTGTDITEFASTQLLNFLNYLPIKYPQVSSMYLFETLDAGGRKFQLLENPTYHNAYKTGIANPAYVSNNNDHNDGIPYSLELCNNVTVPAQKVNLHAYFKTFENDFSYAVYQINGKNVGVVWEAPYTQYIDFSSYKGQTISLTAKAYDSKEQLCATKTYTIKVE